MSEIVFVTHDFGNTDLYEDISANETTMYAVDDNDDVPYDFIT